MTPALTIARRNGGAMFRLTRFIATIVVIFAVSDRASAQTISTSPIRIVSAFAADTPVGAAVQRLASRLQERLGPSYSVSVVRPERTPDGMNENTSLSMLKGDRAEIAITPTTDLGEVARGAFALFDLPFLFANAKEVAAVQQTTAGSVAMAALEGSGFVGLNYFNNGVNSVLTRTVPTVPADFQGQKIRVATPSGGSAISQLGASPVSIQAAEISAALAIGVVDGLETSTQTAILLSPAGGSLPYAAVTPIRPNVSTLLISEAVWRKLSYRAQSIIAEESEKAAAAATESAFKQDSEAFESLSKRASITQVSSVAFSKAALPVWNRAKDVDVVRFNDTILPIIEEFRKSSPSTGPSPDKRGALNDPLVKPAAAVGPRGLKPGEVLFATDRAFEPDPEPRYRVTGRRGDLAFGLATFNIDPSRRMGATDEGLARMTDVGSFPGSEFETRLSAALEAATKKEIVIFVHGFNNAFESASRALALISSDVHFGGVPILFSWPSDGAATRYGSDEEEVRASRDNFLKFVDKVSRTAGVERLHVAAHSMGNRLILEAIDRFDGSSPDGKAKLFHHAVMAAPDVYVNIFKTASPAFQRRTTRVTIYASNKDTALLCSRKVHGGNRRLGEAGPDIFVASGLETIDATEAEPTAPFLSTDRWPALGWITSPCDKGHGYMMRSVRLQADLQNLILTDLPPASRPGLQTKAKDGVDYWAFRPTE